MVVGYKELAEKVLLWRDGLDDRVVEYLKFGFLLKVKKESILYYAGISNSRLEFWVEGLEEGKIGKTGVPEELYKQQLENISSVLDKPSFQAVLRPPRVCIRDYSWESLT